MSDQDMGTMPIPDLVAGIREKAQDMEPLLALTLGILAGRLMKEYERANRMQVIVEACREFKHVSGYVESLYEDLDRKEKGTHAGD